MNTDVLSTMLGEAATGLDRIFEAMEWAEDEIERAMGRHPDQADRIYHCFGLLTPTHPLMSTEFVYRSHCAELLNRVAAEGDTRLGTAAEVCCACSDASALAPFTSEAAGLYLRMWATAGFPHIEEFDERGSHHEALQGSQIDELERAARRKLTRVERRVGDIDCPGLHNGEHVNCAYAKPAQLLLGA